MGFFDSRSICHCGKTAQSLSHLTIKVLLRQHLACPCVQLQISVTLKLMLFGADAFLFPFLILFYLVNRQGIKLASLSTWSQVICGLIMNILTTSNSNKGCQTIVFKLVKFKF